MDKKRLVIIGGGFAGVTLAKNLSNLFEITLIDKKSFFEFTPGIPKALLNTKKKESIQFLYKENIKGTTFSNGTVKSFDKKKVTLENGREIYFDFLIISSGSNYQVPVKAQKKNLDFRIKNINYFHKKILDAKNISIIGGGVVGVEIAAKIASKFNDKKISIIQSGESLLARHCKKTQEIAKKELQSMGVELRLSERFLEESDKYIITNKSKVKSDLNIFCVGIKPNTKFVNKNYLDNCNYIKVNNYFQINGTKNIFAIGDVSDINKEKTAQVAIKQAKLLSKNLKKILSKKKIEPYIQEKTPVIISIGKKAILDYKRFSYFGKIPYLIKNIIQMKFMYSFNKK